MTISLVSRVTLLLLGVLGVGVAVSATFQTENAAAAVAFLAAGVAFVVVGMFGRWPERLVLGGNEIELRARLAKELRDRAADEPDEVAAVVEQVADEFTGRVATPDPVAYDQEVLAALRRSFPDAEVIQNRYRSDSRYDFLVRTANGEVWVESKFVRPPSRNFRGSRMRPLIEAAAAASARLVVVVNVDGISHARDSLRTQLGSVAEMCTWQSPSDDEALKSAVALVLSA